MEAGPLQGDMGECRRLNKGKYDFEVYSKPIHMYIRNLETSMGNGLGPHIMWSKKSA